MFEELIDLDVQLRPFRELFETLNTMVGQLDNLSQALVERERLLRFTADMLQAGRREVARLNLETERLKGEAEKYTALVEKAKSDLAALAQQG